MKDITPVLPFVAHVGARWFRTASLIAVLLAGSSSSVVTADELQQMPTAASLTLRPLSEIDRIVIPPLDMAAIQQEDEMNMARGLPMRVSKPHEVQITPLNAGTWETVDRQTSVWRLNIDSADAWHLQLGFTEYNMPQGGRLQLYAPDMTEIMRPFTAADNQDHRQLWTAFIGGSKMVVEVTIPTALRHRLELTLGWINVGYTRIGPYGPPAQWHGGEGGIDSLSCNIDVLCSQGTGWEDQIKAVGLLSIPGGFVCSGTMVNNTSQDRTPYFLTANHCISTAGTANGTVVFWNYQNSFCRTPGSAQSGQNGNGQLNQFNSGTTLRATWSTTDMTLLQINSSPNAAWGVTFAGWSRAGTNSVGGAGIHHPNGQEKRISIYTGSTNNTSWPSCGNSGTFHVRNFWSQGLTEGGSSGSALFDSSKRIIGQLSGGPEPICGGTNFDCYGRFSQSWTGAGTNATRLSNWLDPLGTAPITLDTNTGVVPVNENCPDATLKLNGTFAFDTTNAGSVGPDENSGCGFVSNGMVTNDIWYKYFAQCTGNATVSVCGSSFNTRLVVYPSCPAGSGTAIACNDNFCGLQSEVTFPVVQNQLYFIRIGGFNGAFGTGTCTISCDVPPPPVCPADINGDQTVGVPDLLNVIGAWGPCGNCASCGADVNGDCSVGVPDLLAVIGAWGPC